MARALAACPRLLVCDEPTGSVDRETADDIFRQLRAYNETMGITVVVVTHDEGLAWTHAHRVVRLESNGEGATLVPAEPRRVQNQEDEEKHKREDGLDEIDGAPADGKAKEGSKPLLGTPRIPELAPSPARTRLYDWLHGVKGEFLPAARTRARLANVLSFIFCPFMAMAAAYMMLGMTLGVEQVVGEINRGLDSVRRVTVYASEAAHAVGVLPGIEEVEAVPHVRDVVGRWDLLGDLLSREDRNDFRRGGFLWPRAEASERYSVTISALAGDDPQWREWGFESPFSGDDAPEAVIHIGSAERLGLSREDFPDAGQKLPKHRRIRLAIPPVGGYERRWSEEERADVDFGGLCLDLKVVAGAPGITPSVAQVVVPAALLRRIIDWRERDRRPEDFPASLSCLGISAADAAAAGTQSRPDPSPAPTVAEMVAAYPPSLYHVYVDELQNVGAVHTAIAEMHKSKDPPIQYDVESNRDAVQTTQGFFTYAAWGLRFLRYMPIFFALVLIFFATLVMVYRRRSDLVLDVVLGAEPLAVHRRYGWVGLVAAGAGAGLGWLGGALAIRGVNLPIQRFLGLDLFLAPGFDKALWLCFAPTVIMSGLIAYFAASYALRPNLADIIRD